jgi:hypothetical protein
MHNYRETPRGSTTLGTPRRMMDNSTNDLNGIGWDSVDWIHVDQDMDQWRALEKTVMKRRAP